MVREVVSIFLPVAGATPSAVPLTQASTMTQDALMALFTSAFIGQTARTHVCAVECKARFVECIAEDLGRLSRTAVRDALARDNAAACDPDIITTVQRSAALMDAVSPALKWIDATAKEYNSGAAVPTDDMDFIVTKPTSPPAQRGPQVSLQQAFDLWATAYARIGALRGTHAALVCDALWAVRQSFFANPTSPSVKAVKAVITSMSADLSAYRNHFEVLFFKQVGDRGSVDGASSTSFAGNTVKGLAELLNRERAFASALLHPSSVEAYLSLVAGTLGTSVFDSNFPSMVTAAVKDASPDAGALRIVARCDPKMWAAYRAAFNAVFAGRCAKLSVDDWPGMLQLMGEFRDLIFQHCDGCTVLSSDVLTACKTTVSTAPDHEHKLAALCDAAMRRHDSATVDAVAAFANVVRSPTEFLLRIGECMSKRVMTGVFASHETLELSFVRSMVKMFGKMPTRELDRITENHHECVAMSADPLLSSEALGGTEVSIRVVPYTSAPTVRSIQAELPVQLHGVVANIQQAYTALHPKRKLQFLPLWSFGTVDWRHNSGTTSLVLSAAHLTILNRIVELAGERTPCTMAELAKALGVSESLVATLCTELTSGGVAVKSSPCGGADTFQLASSHSESKVRIGALRSAVAKTPESADSRRYALEAAIMRAVKAKGALPRSQLQQEMKRVAPTLRMLCGPTALDVAVHRLVQRDFLAVEGTTIKYCP